MGFEAGLEGLGGVELGELRSLVGGPGRDGEGLVLRLLVGNVVDGEGDDAAGIEDKGDAGEDLRGAHARHNAAVVVVDKVADALSARIVDNANLKEEMSENRGKREERRENRTTSPFFQGRPVSRMQPWPNVLNRGSR